MAKEQFFHSESAAILKTLDEAAHRSGVSRGQVFEDYLHMSLCALSGGQMEEQYMATVKKHSEGKKGKRSCDAIAQAFAMLVDAMEKTRQDILGDLFQGGITYGEAGQFLTPEPLCQMMAQMTLDGVETEGGDKKTIADPCCGSGRMLLAAADVQPHWDFVGQDIDLRCVRMTAINAGRYPGPRNPNAAECRQQREASAPIRSTGRKPTSSLLLPSRHHQGLYEPSSGRPAPVLETVPPRHK